MDIAADLQLDDDERISEESQSIRNLVDFCHDPEPDDQNLFSYNKDRLVYLVETLQEAVPDNRFINKVLSDLGWNPENRDFTSHLFDEEVDLATLSTKLETKSSVPRFVGIQFCPECNNMLTPVEDKEKRQLMFQCRYDGVTEPAKDNCIYVSRAFRDVDMLATINTDLASDPTLARMSKTCPRCDHNYCVNFQAQSNRDQSDMKLYYVCLNCRHKWKD